MNPAFYMPVIICVLSAMIKAPSRVYFAAYGLLMAGHYCATSSLSVANYDYYYISDAALCAFLVLCLPKTKEYHFLSLVSCGCILTNILGYQLWNSSLSIGLYDQLYFAIYVVTIIYMLPKAYNDRLNSTIGKCANLFRAAPDRNY